MARRPYFVEQPTRMPVSPAFAIHVNEGGGDMYVERVPMHDDLLVEQDGEEARSVLFEVAGAGKELLLQRRRPPAVGEERRRRWFDGGGRSWVGLGTHLVILRSVWFRKIGSS